MEKPEEKKIKVYTRQRRRSKSSLSFPLDLASEILLRLPEKSIVRFRCVSKAWSSVTTDPYFINLFKTRSPRLLLCFHSNMKLFVSSIPQLHPTFETSNKSHSSYQPSENIIRFIPTESVQGLICFQQESATPIVWNPSTRQFRTLPKHPKSWKDVRILLGYDHVESKHKVICIPKSSDEGRVLTLGSSQEESWRTIKTSLTTSPTYHTSGRCIKGVVYYLSYVYLKDAWVLMSFDVRSEKFDKIQLPPSSIRNDVLVYQGRLAFVDRKPNMKNGIRLWILEKHKWSSKEFLAPFHQYDKSLETIFVLKDFTHTGEFIYVIEGMFPKFYCLLFCDPVRNSFRRFVLDGIIDDEYVLINLHRCTLNVIPNHFESRVSL